jgi:phospholipase/carboxylesterase
MHNHSDEQQANVSRRAFVVSGASVLATAIASPLALRAQTLAAIRPSQSERLTDPSRLDARPTPTTETIAPGTHRLRLGAERDGFLYVPPSYRPAVAAPLLVLLHGAGQSSAEWQRTSLDAVFAAHNVIALVPDSRDATWDIVMGGFGPDVAFIDRALRFTYARCNINPKQIGLMGFSDGASYALSLGITNGDLFSGLVALSPGFLRPATERAKPRMFFAHGTADRILPIDAASRRMVPLLRRSGYDVTYVEFDGPHRIMPPIVSEAVDWFVTGKSPADAKPT